LNIEAPSLGQVVNWQLEVQSAQADFAVSCPQFQLPGSGIGNSPFSLGQGGLS